MKISGNIQFLTMAVIRQGKKKSRHLEVAVMGHGESVPPRLIDRRQFFGQTSNHLRGAWAALNTWAGKTGLTYRRWDGVELKVQIAGIEDGTDVAAFCGTWVNTYVLQPVRFIKGPTNYKKFSEDGITITVSTEYYETIARRLAEKTENSLELPGNLAVYNLCLANVYHWHRKKLKDKETGIHCQPRPIMETAKSENESEAINSVILWPAERVREIFSRLSGARGTSRENAELQIFAERMTWVYDNQSNTRTYWPDKEEMIRLAAYGEAIEDAVRTSKLEAEVGQI